MASDDGDWLQLRMGQGIHSVAEQTIRESFCAQIEPLSGYGSNSCKLLCFAGAQHAATDPSVAQWHRLPPQLRHVDYPVRPKLG